MLTAYPTQRGTLVISKCYKMARELGDWDIFAIFQTLPHVDKPKGCLWAQTTNNSIYCLCLYAWISFANFYFIC